MVKQFSWERKPLEGRVDPRHMSSESSRFSFQQECEVSMWLLADGPVSLCAFLGNDQYLNIWHSCQLDFYLFSYIATAKTSRL